MIFRFGFWKKSLVCLQALLFVHLAVQWKFISFLISFLKKVVGRGSHGSGPGELRRAPFLASWSAFSFPWMPQWALTHLRVIDLCEHAFISVFWQDSVVLEWVGSLASAYRVDWLSLCIVMGVFLSILFSLVRSCRW